MRAFSSFPQLGEHIVATAGRLKRLGLPVGKALTFNFAGGLLLSRSFLCLSLEPGRLVIGWGRRSFFRISVRRTRVYAVDEGKFPTPEHCASNLALFLAETRLRRPDAVLAIPRMWTVLKTAELPATVKENLPAVISYELDRLTPFTPDQAFYDFSVYAEENEKIGLLVGAARSDILTPYVEALKEQGVRVSRVTISSSAVATLSRYVLGDGDSVFVDATEDGYEGGRVEKGNLVDVFAGTFDGQDGKARIDAIEAELRPRVEAGRREGEAPSVLLGDGVGGGEGLRQRLAVRVSTFAAADGALGLRGAQASCPMVGGLMESLWPKAKGINLLERGIHPVVRIPKALTIVLLLALLGVAVFYVAAPLQMERRRLDEINRQILLRTKEVKKVEALKREVEAMAAEIATIERFKTGKPMVLTILRELTETLPKTVWLTRVSISEGKVDMEGYAGSATEILGKLEASKYLKKVEFASPTFRDTRLNADRFVVRMEIEVPENGKKE